MFICFKSQQVVSLRKKFGLFSLALYLFSRSFSCFVKSFNWCFLLPPFDFAKRAPLTAVELLSSFEESWLFKLPVPSNFPSRRFSRNSYCPNLRLVAIDCSCIAQRKGEVMHSGFLYACQVQLWNYQGPRDGNTGLEDGRKILLSQAWLSSRFSLFISLGARER